MTIIIIVIINAYCSLTIYCEHKEKLQIANMGFI